MEYTTISGTDLTLSRLAFGTMRFVPDGGDPSTWEEGERALHAALAGGVTVIHSNSAWPTYPATCAMLEKIPHRGELHHIIKVESPDYGDSGFDAKIFRKQVDTALLRLNVDRISVVQHLQRGPHCPKELAYSQKGDARRLAALPEIAEAVSVVADEMRDAGKIGIVATFPHTVGFASEAVRKDVYRAAVHFFSALEPEMVPLLNELSNLGKYLIGLRPLTQGITTDSNRNRSKLDAEDKRLLGRYDKWYQRLAAVEPLLAEHDESLSRAGLRWGWAHPSVATQTVSMSTVEQVESALAAMEAGPLDVSLLSAVHETVEALPEIGKETLFG